MLSWETATEENNSHFGIERCADASLSIISSNGRILSEKRLSKTPKATFDLTGYLPGTYLIRIAKGQAVQTYRFVISRQVNPSRRRTCGRE